MRGKDANGNWGPVRAVFNPGESCSYVINPAGQSFGADGGAGSVSVSAGANCGWEATAGATWINITSGGLGTGDANVQYTVAANSSNTPRSATMTIAGQTYTVAQAAPQLGALSLSPANVVGGQSSVGTVTLDAPAPAAVAAVALSSGNTAVASVPASVTVAAGATSQTFSVTTQAVAAVSSVNVSAAYAGATRTAALTVAPAPAAPSELTASTGSVNRIDLKWRDNSNNENGFRIERCQGATCTNYALLTTVGANTTSYRNSSLPAGTYYRYRVRANTNVGYSVYSNVATGRTK